MQPRPAILSIETDSGHAVALTVVARDLARPDGLAAAAEALRQALAWAAAGDFTPCTDRLIGPGPRRAA